MADNFVAVNSNPTGSSAKIQTYINTIDGSDVQAEAVVLVNSSGSPITTLPVSVAANVPVTDAGGSITVDGTIAATQSGTWNIGTVTTLPSNASFNETQILGTTIDVNSGTKSAGTQRVVIATDQPALTNKLLVTPDANTAYNLSQVVGTTVDVNSGTKSAGTQRVVLATDQPQLTNKLLVTPDANSAFNLSQILGTTVDGNSGNKSAGTLRVVLATDQPALTNKLLVTPDANTAFNLSQVLGSAVVTATTGVARVGVVGSTGTAFTESVSGVRDTMPRKRDATTGLSPVYYAGRITTKTTTSVTASTAYVSVIKAATSNAGTGATMNFNDLFGSGNRTLAAVNFPGGNMTQGHYLESYTEPIKYTNGIQIVTAGTTMGDCNVAITYWQ